MVKGTKRVSERPKTEKTRPGRAGFGSDISGIFFSTLLLVILILLIACLLCLFLNPTMKLLVLLDESDINKKNLFYCIRMMRSD